MNVTNRRKTTDADTTPTTQSTHHHNSQATPQHHHQPHHPYVSCRQAATTASRSSNHHNRASRQAAAVVVEEEDQEPIVTSTSTDCLLPLQAEGEGEEVNIDLDAGGLASSPARITSSTNNYDILNYSSTDSMSMEEEMVMPTTSENARIERREETSSLSHRLLHRSRSVVNDMVARDITLTLAADANALEGGGGRNAGGHFNDPAASTSSNNSEGQKIILKLPKTSNVNESQMNAGNPEEDVRKVEPLKINLHNTHHHHHNTHHTPKITIKPILKDNTTDAALVSSEECSSSAEDDIVSRISNSEPHIVPKLTIRAKNEDYGSSLTTVVPKLTIKINDPAATTSTECIVSKSNTALNTPPLPKLTIKTGQDGQTESIITNVSPASSTNSSSCSSLACSSASSLSSVMMVTPKLTIKNLHKDKDFIEQQQQQQQQQQHQKQQQLPLIPKLCIKTNTLSTDGGGGSGALVVEEATATATNSKIPKLTIKTGQEHAVIITQHNDNVKNSGGIPKMTIKTKSLETTTSGDDLVHLNLESSSSSMGDKIPKLTIKTNNPMDSTIPKLCLNKNHHEASSASSSSVPASLSPKQPLVVPKLTISRQAVQQAAERTNDSNESVANASIIGIPKMLIKTQSNKTPECLVPKLTLKSLTKRRSSFKEKADDSIEEPMKPVNEFNKTVPKLTIKNVGSPQQRITIVQESNFNLQLQPEAPLSTCDDEVDDFVDLNADLDLDEFNDLINMDNVGEGGESSNSQEFCGFNETTLFAEKKSLEEYRRQSDDMDIDESLQSEHEPQIFQNASHFADRETLNSSSSCLGEERELNGGERASINILPKLSSAAHIIDTVDLTSSNGSSPAAHRFEYNDEEDEEDEDEDDSQQKTEEPENVTTMPQTNILLERLQRENSVIRNAQTVITTNSEENLLPPPPLQPKPGAMINNNACAASSRYPELIERLMTNGAPPTNMSTNAAAAVDYSSQESKSHEITKENIIDSIEILDTPEGSPRNSLDDRPLEVNAISDAIPVVVPNGLHYTKEMLEALNNNNSNLKRHASPQMTTKSIQIESTLTSDGDGDGDGILEELPTKLRKLQNDIDISSATILSNEWKNKTKVFESSSDPAEQNSLSLSANESNITPNVVTPPTSNHQRLRKQKHEHLLPLPSDEVIADTMQVNNSLDSLQHLKEMCNNASASECNTVVMPVKKKMGRPRKSDQVNATSNNAKEETLTNAADNKSRRVQLLRKRLAIDMVDAEQPLNAIDSLRGIGVGKTTTLEEKQQQVEEEIRITTPRKERSLRTPLRTSRRSNTLTSFHFESKHGNKPPPPLATPTISQLSLENKKVTRQEPPTPHTGIGIGAENVLNHFLESNSSNSSATIIQSKTNSVNIDGAATTTIISSSSCINMATQIDLTMSSSSSNSNGSTTNTVTTVEATTLSRLGCTNNTSGIVNINSAGGGGGSSNNSMLPPTTILSSSDPLQDVIFRPNDFSSIIATQQLRGGGTTTSTSAASLLQSLDLALDLNDGQDYGSGNDNSEEDSASSSSLSTTPGRSGGRGRGRGSRGGKAATGRAYRAHRLGRSASAVAKAIAVNRPKWAGVLKHTPDPERIKGLFNPSPQVFEEDTRMSADLTQTPIIPQETTLPTTPIKQPDFLNNEESQSSVISNASMLDPNNISAIQNGSAVKKPVRKKKMEVCVSEDSDFSVASIAEYEWPRPKGCCPSKNRDTFMIQEQVANYLGIKSFKRKYPDLPRRQVDMEERNWLQEQGLVSEKMCDLGITAVWASDILDIMYSDFYEKYEEYKDYMRQKHLREIEAKQKSLGLNVAGRGLQARDRAMLNASKWNSYFNKTRKEERMSCLDLQTLVINKPCPASAPISAIPHRPVAEAIVLAAKVENIPQPPTLLSTRDWEPIRCRDVYYPLSLVPGQFCEKYYYHSPEELRRLPLNTVLSHPKHLWQQQQDNESQSSDTDSAVESIENDMENEASIASGSTILRKRRIRRTRTKLSTSNEEFKIPPIPGAASVSATSSNDSSTSTDETSSDSDSDSSHSAASSEEYSEDENSPATCGVCLRPQNRNLKKLPELFIQCYTCRRKVHPSCIEMPHRMSNRVRNYNWQCVECKCCVKCRGRQDQNKMLFCEQCDRGFHVYCLGVKTVPDGRWSCDRCSICMRCGATKPEGLPTVQQTCNKQSRQKKLKWVNEYRVDHVTKIKEHCSMLCIPCGRTRITKRVQIAIHNNTTNTYVMNSPGSSSGALSPNCSSGQCSPGTNTNNTNHTVTTNATATTTVTNSTTTATTEAVSIDNNADTVMLTVSSNAANLDTSNPSSPTQNCCSSKTSTDLSTVLSGFPATTESSTTTTTSQQHSASVTATCGSGGGGGPPPVVA